MAKVATNQFFSAEFDRHSDLRVATQLRDLPVKFRRESKKALDALAESGANFMRLVVATSATPWVREHLGREGRIVTETMYNSITVKKNGDEFHPVTRTAYNVTFGFGADRRRKFRDYFKAQEEGTYRDDGKGIPMRSVPKANDYVEQMIEDVMDRVVRAVIK